MKILLIIPLLALISFINKKATLVKLSSGGLWLVYFFGIVGVPIHELSHYLFCKLFNHKVNKVCLFSPNKETGTLGYVNHSYSKRSLYQRIGMLFIAIAPMVVGTTLIIFLYSYFDINNFSFDLISNDFKLISKYLAFAYLFLAISSHMVWSVVDMKNSISGLFVLIPIIYLIIKFAPDLLFSVFDGLILVAIFSLINLALSLLMGFVIKVMSKKLI